jgi:hypothetical protein
VPSFRTRTESPPCSTNASPAAYVSDRQRSSYRVSSPDSIASTTTPLWECHPDVPPGWNVARWKNTSTGRFAASFTPSDFAWTRSVVRAWMKLTTSVIPPPGLLRRFRSRRYEARGGEETWKSPDFEAVYAPGGESRKRRASSARERTPSFA